MPSSDTTKSGQTRSTSRRIVGIAGYFLMCAIALGAGAAVRWVGSSKVASAYVMQTLRNEPPKEAFGGLDTVTLLLLGCDEDVSYGGKKVTRKLARSDTMLVVRLDFSKNRISGVGIPRDLLVELPGYRSQKINAYHAIGGKDLAQAAAEKVLGIKIDRTITIDYESFIRMVDMVGGVDVYVPKRMKYTDKRANPPLYIDFKPGRQHMDGYQSMCFVRFRHSDDTFHRQDRQVDFMLAFKETLKGQPQLVAQVADQAMAVLGGGLDGSEVAALARFAQGVPKDSIKFGAVPVLPASNYNFNLDEGKLPETLRQFNLVDPAVKVSLNP